MAKNKGNENSMRIMQAQMARPPSTFQKHAICSFLPFLLFKYDANKIKGATWIVSCPDVPYSGHLFLTCKMPRNFQRSEYKLSCPARDFNAARH